MSQAAPLISIVDDDESLKLALVGLVRSFGYEGRGHASAEDFLASGDAGQCACLVTDLHMPGLGGIELLQRLRADGNAVPAVLITARMQPGLEQRARDAGARCLLPKPFDPQTLMRCIEQALPSLG